MERSLDAAWEEYLNGLEAGPERSWADELGPSTAVALSERLAGLGPRRRAWAVGKVIEWIPAAILDALIETASGYGPAPWAVTFAEMVEAARGLPPLDAAEMDELAANRMEPMPQDPEWFRGADVYSVLEHFRAGSVTHMEIAEMYQHLEWIAEWRATAGVPTTPERMQLRNHWQVVLNRMARDEVERPPRR